jgi:inner membrane protein
VLPIELVARAMEALTVALAGSVKARLGHRGPVHSLAVCLGLTLLVILSLVVLKAPCAPRWVGAAFGLGYLSHLIGDGLTARGVPLWWPVSARRMCLGPAAARAFISRLLC